MISVLNITRNSCRGSVLRILQSRSPTIGNLSHTFFQKSKVLRCTSHFSTSQCVLSKKDHSHSAIWTAERFLSAGLIGVLPLAIAYPNPILDYTLALALSVHVHWGIEAIVVDYVRPSVVGHTLSRLAGASVYALSVLTLGGLFYFNYSDVGLGQAIRMLWKL